MPPLTLVVEDEPAIRLAVRDSLAAAGHEVAVAEDGRTALTMALSHRYDLIVRPVRTKEATAIETPKVLPYTILAHQPKQLKGPISIPVRNVSTGGTMQIQWRQSEARPGDASLEKDLGLEIAALELREALLELEALNAAEISDDVLGAIFSQCCVGK